MNVYHRGVEEPEDPPEPRFLTAREFARKLRSSRTPAEKALWEIVNRPEFCEWRFKQQVNIGSHFLDVAATSIKLDIEVDGESHDNRPEQDEARDRSLAELNWAVLRFRNEQVINRPEEVAAIILNTCRGRIRFRY